jgi:CDP-glycerol glycerophosphotransferase
MRIAFHSYDGRFSDSPRTLYEAISRAGYRDELVWTAHPVQRQFFPSEVVTVGVGSAECVAALQEADLVIANNHLDFEWEKKPGAIYLQTWHGTPLKRIHWDVLWAPEGRLDRLSRDVARWDWLLSPNRASTARLRNAFRFAGEVLQTGYPRNDVLSSSAASTVRSRVRAELDIPEGTVAVLYAPTWRDDVVFDESVAVLADALKLEDALSALGTGYCVLRRLHYMVADRWESVDHPQVRDVSYYPEISDLYLAADVLITDYSSAMFDFAITGKPILLHSHDLADYRDRLRGFYFDLTVDPPGPMLESVDDVTSALRDLPSVQDRWREAYARFRTRYGDLNDGHATERVLSHIDALR